MKFLVFTFIALFAISGCQSSRHNSSTNGIKREVANSQVFKRFITRLAERSGTNVADIETSIISYLKRTESNSNFANHVAIGISEDQASKIKSLSDDFPFMPKVQKWAMENITKVSRGVKQDIAREVYEEIAGASAGLINPYARSAGNQTSNLLRRRQQEISPLSSISEKHENLLSYIQTVDGTSTKRLYRKVLVEFEKRGQTSPGVLANGQRIVESAADITRLTGKNGMGDGCEAFIKSSSSDILSAKADVDIRRSEIITEMAHNKAGRSFASVDEIPSAKRLTQDEIDQATIKSMQDVLGYTDDEARAALNRLKQKPCRVY